MNSSDTFFGGVLAGALFMGFIAFGFHKISEVNKGTQIEVLKGRAYEANTQLSQCNQHLQAASLALTHKINGDSLMTSGPVCVINADLSLDEGVISGYLRACKINWDLKRKQQATEGEEG